MHHKLALVRGAAKLFLFLLGTLILVPFQLILMFLWPKPKSQSPIVRVWFRYVTRLLGVRYKIKGKRYLSKQQKIFLGNHISYVDIVLLGGVFDCYFVAKNDVASWPFFGFLSKLGGTVFISRARKDIAKQIPLLKKHIEQGQSLYLFPEGTTTNGREVLQFKSSLLNVLNEIEHKPSLQPITLAYTHLNGKKMKSQDDFDAVAWYADMTLLPHLWALFKQKNVTAEIVIHTPIETKNLSIKEVNIQAQYVVAEGFKAIFE